MSFAELLRTLGGVSGILRIRFMTSHPKDFPDELIRAMAELGKLRAEHGRCILRQGEIERLIAASEALVLSGGIHRCVAVDCGDGQRVREFIAAIAPLKRPPGKV